MENRVVNVLDVIDRDPLGRFRVVTIGLCAIVALLDGFDTQAIAFVASAIAQDWKVNIATFGAVFAAGLFGLMLGALIMGPVADRFGRKKIIVFATAWFGACSLLTAWVTDIQTLVLVRFLTGLGLGAAMPNIIALTSEYAPRHRCTTLVTLMFCGFPMGALLGGIVSVKLIAEFGWGSVFIVGGLAPLAMAIILAIWLPESIRYVVTRGTEAKTACEICQAIHREGVYTPQHSFVLDEERLVGSPIKHLFTRNRAAGTIALWVVFFSNLLLLYFLVNWLPSVLQRAGMPIDRAIVGVVALNAGGIIGGLLLGKIIDKVGPYMVLALTYLAAAPLVAAIGFIESFGGVIAVILCAGFCVLGAQFGINALAANYYPTRMRSTGVGWALGMGRIGSIVGPLLGGLMITAHWTTEMIFGVTAVTALLAAIAVFVISRLSVRSCGESDRADLVAGEIRA
ncbi:MFS transporter [Pseudorhodoplanes sp.]|uniref:MFS transporter n=1 Tax=Pseudorhodoplanes sp. TaxID=1934341 RepID=UPI003D12B569